MLEHFSKLYSHILLKTLLVRAAGAVRAIVFNALARFYGEHIATANESKAFKKNALATP